MSYTQCQKPKHLPKGHRHQYNSGSPSNCQRPGSKPVLTQPHSPIWNHISRVREDPCTQRVDEIE